MEPTQTPAGKLPASDDGDAVIKHRAQTTSQNPSVPAPSMAYECSVPPGMAEAFGLLPSATSSEKLLLQRLESPAEECAREKREKQALETKNKLLEAEVRYKDEVIKCLKGTLERHNLL
ncbi:uncharacterized protein FFB20_14442 [Fusarium fujikuroi]|nr:uncharacterized protein Y057_7592 [Fusarium fujikuroi]QGI66651.1 hypothetical protein CEK27_010622 [Fusarium fujikuroi]QGI83889.1 hypothetical protein CEK25_010618 [Fusarium fujikuroi]QGI97541.1 hypothetical protein CEK26_010610 [Fusarium fujikuroi]SCO14074.1 uncharacterized protein FFB20_14442 [Fusarium fujikuroi]